MGIKSQMSNKTTGYAMLIPASILFVFINAFPFLYSLILSLTDTNFIKDKSGIGNFIGLKNYFDILFNDPEFYSVLLFTFIYTILVVAITYCLGLLMAMLLNRNIKFRGVFRAVALLPWIVPTAVAAISFRYLLNDQIGFVNVFLQNIGLIKEPILFLADPGWARFSVIMLTVWKEYPFMMVVLLAGLQSIGPEMYEPAYIDGANSFRAFRYITMPLLRPVTLVSVSLLFIWTFNSISFDNIYLLTMGGPANATYVLSIQSYYVAFFRNKIGYASAISFVMLLVISIAIIIYAIRKKRKGEIVI